ncbi:MAG: hypothetical protein M3173_07460, partial [Chloroflexota bacterium]|nr:hypothetical protein [Chloroflexota bacterium]
VAPYSLFGAYGASVRQPDMLIDFSPQNTCWEDRCNSTDVPALQAAVLQQRGERPARSAHEAERLSRQAR